MWVAIFQPLFCLRLKVANQTGVRINCQDFVCWRRIRLFYCVRRRLDVWRMFRWLQIHSCDKRPSLYIARAFNLNLLLNIYILKRGMLIYDTYIPVYRDYFIHKVPLNFMPSKMAPMPNRNACAPANPQYNVLLFGAIYLAVATERRQGHKQYCAVIASVDSVAWLIISLGTPRTICSSRFRRNS